MKIKYSLVKVFVMAAIALFTLPAYLALAWPEEPPTKATISGPGIKGVVAISDKDMLAALKLGAIEDLQRGPIAAPQVGDGYTITRYFYGGTFNFARLQYYPNVNGRAYIYFEDGPDLSGNHTPYHQKWLYATAQGDAAMQKLLSQLVPPAKADNVLLRPEVLFGIVIALFSVLMLAGWLLIVRANRHRELTAIGQEQSVQ